MQAFAFGHERRMTFCRPAHAIPGCLRVQFKPAFPPGLPFLSPPYTRRHYKNHPLALQFDPAATCFLPSLFFRRGCLRPVSLQPYNADDP